MGLVIIAMFSENSCLFQRGKILKRMVSARGRAYSPNPEVRAKKFINLVLA